MELKSTMTLPTTINLTLKVRDIPPSWRVALPDDPDATVEVAITPVARGGSPKHFLGAGQGAFATPDEADAHIRHDRDAWRA